MDSHEKPGSLDSSQSPARQQAQPLHEEDSCLGWEAALVDLLDGVLAPDEEARLRAHAETCPQCLALLQEAERGRDWARLLHDAPPAVPEELLGRILARTAGTSAGQDSGGVASGSSIGTPLAAGNVLVLPHPAAWTGAGQRQARILMTAAMAFFSIALTLSMTGFHLSELRAAAHAPASLSVAASRQFFDTKKQVVSFYDNLRLVREMEATVEDMRQSANSNGGKAARPRRLQPSARRLSGDPARPLLANREPSRSSLRGNEHQADERNTL